MFNAPVPNPRRNRRLDSRVNFETKRALMNTKTTVRRLGKERDHSVSFSRVLVPHNSRAVRETEATRQGAQFYLYLTNYRHDTVLTRSEDGLVED